MRRSFPRFLTILAASCTLGPGLAPAAEPAAPPTLDAAERGRIALTARSYLKGGWTDASYSKAGQSWGPAAPDPDRDPESYAKAFLANYGLNTPPYPNDGLPMGLRKGVNPDGTRSGITVDCLMCHGGSIGGNSYVGLGNTQLDCKRLFDDMMRASGQRMPPSTFVINSSRGTVNAGMFSAVLLALRNSDLSRRIFPIPLAANIPELDVPAWWILGKKSTMYYDGRTATAASRANMQFLLGEKSLDELKALEPTFDDIAAYLKSIKPPKYPFPIDPDRSARGQLVFENTCSRCHGTYGEGGEYPNRIIPLKEIGTDPERAKGLSDRLVAHYNTTWLAEGHLSAPKMTGYQAPPLDGIWATAPYLHNGSVPTLDHLLNSPTRPARFKRPPSTSFDHYDRARVGWKAEPIPSPESLTPAERPFFYDTSRFGLGNSGHTFGDKLTPPERSDLIEYLKTL